MSTLSASPSIEAPVLDKFLLLAENISAGIAEAEAHKIQQLAVEALSFAQQNYLAAINRSKLAKEALRGLHEM